MTTIIAETNTVGTLRVQPFAHPQGCRSYLLGDPRSKQAMVIDPHLDLVDAITEVVREGGWSLPYVIDTHTHADHPSGAGALAERFSSTRIAHEAGHHHGVARHPDDGDVLHLGDSAITVRHAPGHTPDHIVLMTDEVLFSGDTLFIGGVARTDFLGGDAGQLFDSIHRVIADLHDDVVLYPGHDYQGRISSRIGAERADNPWLKVSDRAAFVEALTADKPLRPANMDDLLRLNREGVAIPTSMSAKDCIERVKAGAATSIIDVRTGAEFDSRHVPGSRLIPLDQIGKRLDEVMATPAPRLIMCRSGARSEMARKELSAVGIGGVVVVTGGIEAYAAAGGETLDGEASMSLERQVRIVAGLMAVIGTALGFLLTPWLFLLPGFIGAGLVWSGVTDTCAMGMMIAKLPHNRRSGTGPEGAAAGGCAASAPAGGCAASAPTGGCAAGAPKS